MTEDVRNKMNLLVVWILFRGIDYIELFIFIIFVTGVRSF